MTAITGFHLMMPPGWSRYRVDEEGRKQFMAKLGARMKELGHPELDVRLRMLAGTQWRRLEETRTHSVYLPDSEIEGMVRLPMSIALRQHVAPVGVRFGDALRDLTSARIDVYDTAIGPVQRWQSDRAGEGETEGIVNRALGYGFAVPNADDRRGLIFTASIPHPDGADAALVEAATELVDTIMETFRWR